jgi:hypothetical protein
MAAAHNKADEEQPNAAGHLYPAPLKGGRRGPGGKSDMTFGIHDAIRLKTAAQIAFPDGSLGEPALRAAIRDRRLGGFLMHGKYLTTLHDLERYKEQCRVSPKEPGSGSESPAVQSRGAPPKRESMSSSVTDAKLARDAAVMTAQRLKQSLRSSSSKDT